MARSGVLVPANVQEPMHSPSDMHGTVMPSSRPTRAAGKALPIAAVEGDDGGQIGPEKRALGEKTAADDRIAAPVTLPNEAFGDHGRIVQQLDPLDRFFAQVVVVDQSEMPEPQLSGDRVHQ